MKRYIVSLALSFFLAIAAPARADNDMNGWHGIFVVDMQKADKTKPPKVVFFGGKEYIDAQVMLETLPPIHEKDGTWGFPTPDSEVATTLLVKDDEFDVVLLRDDCVAHLVVKQVSPRRIGIALPPVIGFVWQVIVPHKFGQLDGACSEFRSRKHAKKRR
ncbi:MAG: hypothetical protein EXS55_03935 [Candidatus Magasanikbacteria bacterium]|nr:hypothetical protein [Candidatus Magasanikbacteria bacterium]